MMAVAGDVMADSSLSSAPQAEVVSPILHYPDIPGRLGCLEGRAP